MKKIITIIASFFIIEIGLSQSFSDNLYEHLYNFQILKGELKEGDFCSIELKKSFYVQELVLNTNTPTFEVYTFYNLKYEEVNVDFLVIENNNFELYDVLGFSVLIDRILDKDVDFVVKTLWIKEILKVLDSYKNVNLDNSIVVKNVNNFTYFIPLRNYRNDLKIE